MNELYHYGILGMKWGVRRYQNKDGSLTSEGRKRLRLDKYDDDHNEDIVIKKGTKASRVVSTSDFYEYSDPDMGGSAAAGKKYVQDVLKRDRQLDSKYFSVDGVRNSGRLNGKDYYVSWFTDEGYDPDSAQVTTYTLKKDVKIASGKKVMDALLEEAGADKIESLLKDNRSAKALTLDYTGNKELFNKINKKFEDMGYDGVEDVNDLDTDMPIILFDSTQKAIRDVKVQSGRDAVNELIKKYSKTSA